MTRTTSVKRDLKHGVTVFLYQLKKCKTPLILFAVIAAFFITVILSLALVTANTGSRYGTLLYSEEAQINAMTEAGLFFQTLTALSVFLLTCVFTIIYTLRVFSYLHNKRKADRINPLPVKSGVLFMGKSLAAFAAAVVPALFFIGIICIISACFGIEVREEVLRLFLQIPLGSAACISFYGLMAVCCGSSANTVLSFLAICFCYPLAANLISGMIGAFFYGMTPVIDNNHFLFKALNPMAAYDGVNAIYWLLFTAACFALSVLLLRRRKAERAQTSFAYRLPCYAVEMLITFISGMLLGIMFATTKVLGASLAGFVFGFLLGGGTAFVIAHVILFKGFRRILKSLIFFGAVSAAAIIFTSVCCLASPAFSTYLPEIDDIQSAGYIQYTSEMQNLPDFADTGRLVRGSAEDYTDKQDFEKILQRHESFVKQIDNFGESDKFRKSLSTSVPSILSSMTGVGGGKETIAYKLKDGSVVTRCYNPYYLMPGLLDYVLPIDENSYYSVERLYGILDNTSHVNELTTRPDYLQRYSLIGKLTADDVESISDDSYVTNGFTIPGTEENRADIEKLFNAFQSDYLTHGTEGGYSTLSLTFTFNVSGRHNTLTVFSLLGVDRVYNMLTQSNQAFTVYNDYAETRSAMKEIGLLTEDGVLNRKSKYFTSDEHYNSSNRESAAYYSKNETAYIGNGWVTLPWDCSEVWGEGNVSFYDDSGTELLMFESTSKTNFHNDEFDTVKGYEDTNEFAGIFQVIGIESKDKNTVEDGCCGRARVIADGKELTLRFIQFGTDYGCQVMFLTDKVTDEEYTALAKSYESDI